MPVTKELDPQKAAREATLLAKRGLLNRYFPIKTNFGSSEVNTWVAHLRDGSRPPNHVFDQLASAGWEVFDIELVGSNVPPNVFVKIVTSLALSRSTLSRAIDYGWQQREAGIMADLLIKPPSEPWSHATRHTLQITGKDSSTFLGLHNDREVRLFISHESGKPSQMIVVS